MYKKSHPRAPRPPGQPTAYSVQQGLSGACNLSKSDHFDLSMARQNLYILNVGNNKDNKTSGLEHHIPWMACGATQQFSAALFWQVDQKNN